MLILCPAPRGSPFTLRYPRTGPSETLLLRLGCMLCRCKCAQQEHKAQQCMARPGHDASFSLFGCCSSCCCPSVSVGNPTKWPAMASLVQTARPRRKSVSCRMLQLCVIALAAAAAAKSLTLPESCSKAHRVHNACAPNCLVLP